MCLYFKDQIVQLAAVVRKQLSKLTILIAIRKCTSTVKTIHKQFQTRPNIRYRQYTVIIKEFNVIDDKQTKASLVRCGIKWI